MKHRNTDAEHIEHDFEQIDKHHHQRGMLRDEAVDADHDRQHNDPADQVGGTVHRGKSIGYYAHNVQQEEHDSRKLGEHFKQHLVFFVNAGE